MQREWNGVGTCEHYVKCVVHLRYFFDYFTKLYYYLFQKTPCFPFFSEFPKKVVESDGRKLARHIRNRGRPTEQTWQKYRESKRQRDILAGLYSLFSRPHTISVHTFHSILTSPLLSQVLWQMPTSSSHVNLVMTITNLVFLANCCN